MRRGKVGDALLTPKHKCEPVKYLGSKEFPGLFDDPLLGVASMAAVVLHGPEPFLQAFEI